MALPTTPEAIAMFEKAMREWLALSPDERDAILQKQMHFSWGQVRRHA